MRKRRLVFFGSLLACAQAAAQPADSSPPVQIPGHAYVQTPDGCGVLLEDAGTEASFLEARKYLASRSWLGACREGLADGYGYWLDASLDSWLALQPALMLAGKQQPSRASIAPSAGVSTLSAGATVSYSLLSEDNSSLALVIAPMVWNIDDPYVPYYTSDNGSALDDFTFTVSEGRLGTASDGRSFSIGARNCLIAGRKIKGCRALYGEFSVYGVLVTTTRSDGSPSSDVFTLCPDPRTPVGCDGLWREVAGRDIDQAAERVRKVRAKLHEEIQAVEARREGAFAALPSEWRAHWQQHPPVRQGMETALRCLGISDLHPVSPEDAQRILAKYSTPPCQEAHTAAQALHWARSFIAIDAEGKRQEDEIQASYARARAERDASNAQAWSEFLGNASAMLGAYMQVQAPAAVVPTTASMPAPAYQPYGQPASQVAPTAAGSTQVRPIHRPELEATSCVSLVQLSEGDPLSSYGSQGFSNRCGESVEVFWCKVGDECERGAGGTWTVHAGRLWPVSSGQYRWGACRGANSGGLVRESNGQHTGRYACTGP